MEYNFNKKISVSFDDAYAKLEKILKEEGFGILTEIDMKKILKEKLNVDFKEYKILKVCNPKFAHRALLAEDKIGIFLPCNIVVQKIDKNITEIAIVNPVASMTFVKNDEMQKIAMEIQQKLLKIYNKI
jgi:uncharacterized protein (DUF302 family)